MTNTTYRMMVGDAFAVLPTLPVDSVHCCVTSPPFFALRSYLPADHPDKGKEIGSEPDPESFIRTMVAVFREVRRVLHPSGLLFLNLGDSYNAGGRIGNGTRVGYKQQTNVGTLESGDLRANDAAMVDGQLLDIPHRVAAALRADGWVWRQTVIWHKTSPMPEPVKGWRWEKHRVKVKPGESPARNMRPETRRQGVVMELPKKASTFPAKAKYEPCPGCPKCIPNGGLVLRKGKGRCTSAYEFIFVMAKSSDYFWDSAAFVEEAVGGGTRNPRSVWTMSSEPTKVAFFSAYPSELVRRCIQAGTSDGGCCPSCLAPLAPVIDTQQLTRNRPNDRTAYHSKPTGGNSCGNTVAGVATNILGYKPTCECYDPATINPSSIPCTVLDPCAGICTTLQTAQWLGRNSIGIELNEKYAAIGEKRIEQPPRWWKRRGK